MELVDRFGGKRRLIVDFAEDYLDVNVDQAELVSMAGQQAIVQFDRKAITASELIGRLSNIYRIRDLQVLEPSIEDTIRRIYEQRLLERID